MLGLIDQLAVFAVEFAVLLAADVEVIAPPDGADAARMQAREDELLIALGYAGAYAHGH